MKRPHPMKRRLHTTEADPHIPDAQEPEEEEKGPQRRCIVTREQGAREAMLRFVLDPNRRVVPDLAARLPGRGMWLSARADVLEAARAKKVFARAARGPVTLPDDLIASVQAGLARRVTDHLGLARRAGQAVAGFAKAREWLEAGRAGLVVQASDGSEDERRRLMSGARDVTVAWPMTGAELGAIFGREQAVHVALLKGRLAETLANEIGRLAGVTGRVLFLQAGE
jgi:predicted RNA-binding protein YlxR (DUF448 family)